MRDTFRLTYWRRTVKRTRKESVTGVIGMGEWSVFGG
jgi:hypothetical protein